MYALIVITINTDKTDPSEVKNYLQARINNAYLSAPLMS